MSKATDTLIVSEALVYRFSTIGLYCTESMPQIKYSTTKPSTNKAAEAYYGGLLKHMPKLSDPILLCVSGERHTLTVGECLKSISDDDEHKDMWESWCIAMQPEYVLGTVDYWWGRLRTNVTKITDTTLRSWARHDDSEKFGKVIEFEIEDFFDSLTEQELTSYDVGEIINIMYRDRFRCSSYKKKIWWHYDQHRWHRIDKGYVLRLLISTEVANIFIKQSAGLHTKALVEMDLSTKAKLMRRCSKLHKVIERLKSTSFKNDIMTEAAEIMCDPEFEQQLDVHRHLLGFENGTYDLQHGYFRSGSPEDKLTYSMGVRYEEDEDEEFEEEIYDFLNKIIPDPDVLEYVLRFLGSCLEGGNKEELFNIWIGSGGNGKSKLVELFEMVVGDYACKFPVSLLTQKRARSNAATPELAGTKGKRFGTFQEPEENVALNVGMMKELSGGDMIMARPLFCEPIEFKPQFKLLLLCNQLPHIPAKDGGTWRRLRVVRFVSEFVDTVTRPHQFKKDPNLSSKFQLWAPQFLRILLRAYERYRAEGLTTPDAVLSSTSEYQKKSDCFREFCEESLVVGRSHSLSLKDAYTSFKLWYQDSQNKKPPNRGDFTELMTIQFGTMSGRCWKGVGLADVGGDDIIVV